ncbi:D-alanyl-D-alanine carboxypeptidase family protein [Filobacillus milosensis]|uniref:D-alanyl-D-alanine carboxypeptidase family protein n=1 Tax=Filobacillus milosensis TaxID=94137 RepID=UPI001E39E38A|nr:D-alanyl-D-alanine carboxypeptidase family protein [Filobacillus milosensis]
MKKTILFISLIVLFLSNNIYAQEQQQKLLLNSEAVILIDANTGEVLYEKNSDQVMFPASITKILTAIIAIEEGNLNDSVTVSENARQTGGTRVYLEPGERVTLDKLVKGLLLNSGNDAGVAIAEHMDGSVEAFARRMNRFVDEKIGFNHSNFENPHGLYDEDHVTTAEDMAKITQYAMENPKFRKIAATKSLKWDGEGWDTVIYNHHRLVRQRDDVTGVKNGFVGQAGFTLVTSATRDHIDLIAVTLKADTADLSYVDTERLLEYGFENFQTYSISATGEVFNEGTMEYVFNEDLTFTASKGEEISEDVNNGELIVKNNEGELLVEQPLTQVQKPEKEEKVKKDVKASQVNGVSSVNAFMVILALGLVTFFIIKTRNRRKKRFFY